MKIYVVFVEDGEYDTYFKEITSVTTDLEVAKKEVVKALDEYSNDADVTLEVWEDNKYLGVIKHEKKKIVHYEIEWTDEIVKD